MALTVTIPDGFEYVGAALISTLWVLFVQYWLVNKTRKRAGIAYPQMYADRQQQKESKDALIFNCAQRAHQNTLENLPLVYLATIFTGFFHPTWAAASCGMWVVGRFFYTFGYITGDPNKRQGVIPAVGGLSLLGPFLFSTYKAGTWIVEGLKAYLQTKKSHSLI